MTVHNKRESCTACHVTVDMHSCNSACQWKEKYRIEKEGELKWPVIAASDAFLENKVHWPSNYGTNIQCLLK